MSPYVLVCELYIRDTEVAQQKNGRFEHVGYVSKIFKTKKAACREYDSNNSHMRSLNAHGTWCSDWDPNTLFRYRVEKYHGQTQVLCEHLSLSG